MAYHEGAQHSHGRSAALAWRGLEDSLFTLLYSQATLQSHLAHCFMAALKYVRKMTIACYVITSGHAHGPSLQQQCCWLCASKSIAERVCCNIS